MQLQSQSFTPSVSHVDDSSDSVHASLDSRIVRGLIGDLDKARELEKFITASIVLVHCHGSAVPSFSLQLTAEEIRSKFFTTCADSL